jgi:hypothetical protein
MIFHSFRQLEYKILVTVEFHELNRSQKVQITHQSVNQVFHFS